MVGLLVILFGLFVGAVFGTCSVLAVPFIGDSDGLSALAMLICLGSVPTLFFSGYRNRVDRQRKLEDLEREFYEQQLERNPKEMDDLQSRYYGRELGRRSASRRRPGSDEPRQDG